MYKEVLKAIREHWRAKGILFTSCSRQLHTISRIYTEKGNKLHFIIA